VKQLLTGPLARALLAELRAGLLVEDGLGEVVYSNADFCRLLGLDEPYATLVGQSAEAVFERVAALAFLDPAGFRQGVDELRMRRVAVYNEPFTTTQNIALERDVLPVIDGEHYAGMIWIFRDLTEQMHSAAVERQKLFYDSILEALPAQLAVFSPTGTYEYVTPSAIADREIRQWIIGRTDVEYGMRRKLPTEVTAQRRERIREVVESKSGTQFEESFTTRDGELRHFRRYSTPIFDEHGEVRHVLGYGLDITVQRRVEEQLMQSQKMDAVGRLAGGIAHDFNNLLTVINGFTEALREELEASDERRALVDPVLQASRRAAELTNQLLAFSRQAVVEPKVLDLNRVVQETTSMLKRLLGESIIMQVDPEPGELPVRAGAGQLQQVLLNLVVNARDAMRDGGTLMVKTRRVKLAASPETDALNLSPGRYLELRVTDTGTGMTDEVRRRLFEPFFTTKEVGRGTGLGLSTVYGIITDAGGRIMVESTLGVGSSFRVLMPEFLERRSETRSGGNTRAIPRGTETVLVAEDEPGVRDLVQRILTTLGYTVLMAVDGQDALKVAAAYDAPIDLLLSDVVMPNMNGSALAKLLRLQRPDIKVIYMSGYTDDDVLRHGIAAEDTAFMQKPFTVAVLAQRIREILDGVQ
jgi:signal transduction histidine kinase/CheY-like chemotaxis protein